jgi:hypothetical protein
VGLIACYIASMTASPPPLVPPLVSALRDVREILERARHSGDVRDVEQAIERINRALDEAPAQNKLGGEECLPAEFFEKLGRYVATCGHIEEVVWRIIVRWQVVDLDTRDGVRRAHAKRHSTGTLVRDFEEIGNLQPEPIRSSMLDMASRMSRTERGPRNLAVHGAWRWDAAAQTYRVCSSKALLDAAENGRPLTAEVVAQNEVDDALIYVDRILQHLLVIEQKITEPG